MRNKNDGFTLVEMLFVIAAIAVLATIAIPQMAQAIQKAKEGGAKANLAKLKSALSFYSGDTGNYPATLAALSPNYLSTIPAVKGLAYHEDTDLVTTGLAATDAGGWLYNDTAGNPKFGTISINCTHTDIKGQSWSLY